MPLTRRRCLQVLTAAGVGTATFRRALAGQAEGAAGITPEMIAQAEWVAGITLSEEHREATREAIDRLHRNLEILRQREIPYDCPPALQFVPQPGPSEHGQVLRRNRARLLESAAGARPASDTDLAFLPVHELAPLLRERVVSSTELTKLYIDRLRRFDPDLRCVVTLTEDLALNQAKRADEELRAGHYRGPLHGIPWGAKDLLAYPGYPTTWGAPPFREQILGTKATVAKHLDEAGAVLVAKLSLGALAMGDRWFGGLTRNPWNIEEGSSGSSAGSAAAVTAGLVGFAIGSETLGSIVSPCRRCGATGLRPTFGRVSRAGCMPLSWSMDKIGPIARSAQDTALVLDAIHGADPGDPASRDQPFEWPCPRGLESLRVGYLASADEDRPEINSLEQLGVTVVPVELPSGFPVWEMMIILTAEAATVFDDITRQGITEGLNTWPVEFRKGRFISAVDYLRANRLRTQLMEAMETLFREIDLFVDGGDGLGITNLTGHPTLVLPHGMLEKDGIARPGSLSLTGRLFGESELVAVGHALQLATGDHRMRPPRFAS